MLTFYCINKVPTNFSVQIQISPGPNNNNNKFVDIQSVSD